MSDQKPSTLDRVLRLAYPSAIVIARIAGAARNESYVMASTEECSGVAVSAEGALSELEKNYLLLQKGRSRD